MQKHPVIAGKPSVVLYHHLIKSANTWKKNPKSRWGLEAGRNQHWTVRNKEVYPTERGTPLSPPPSEKPASHWWDCWITPLWLARGLVTERLLFPTRLRARALVTEGCLIHALVEPHLGILRTIIAARTERMKVCLHRRLWRCLLLASDNSISSLVRLLSFFFFLVRKQNQKVHRQVSDPIWYLLVRGLCHLFLSGTFHWLQQLNDYNLKKNSILNLEDERNNRWDPEVLFWVHFQANGCVC